MRIQIETSMFHFDSDVKGCHHAKIEVVFHPNFLKEILAKNNVIIAWAIENEGMHLIYPTRVAEFGKYLFL
jgi:hypothetical protein